MKNSDDPPRRPYASPPCLAHELDPLYRDNGLVDDDGRRDLNRWRKAERERLRALRHALSPAERQLAIDGMEKALDLLLGSAGVASIGAYWPIHDEPDLRAWMRRQSERGLKLALPVVATQKQPLKYCRWHPGTKMKRGVWGIAEPVNTEWIEPELVIAPLLGVDEQKYRLGNGGGYFDRTLAAADWRPLAVGVGFACARIKTIYPQVYDIPMDEVIIGPTE